MILIRLIMRRRGYIYHTVVARKYRKQGIATELIDAAIRWMHLDFTARQLLMRKIHF